MPRGQLKQQPRQRRPKGSGSVVVRGDGRVEVRVPKPGGGYTYRTARDREHAEALLGQHTGQAAPAASGDALTVAAYLRQWLETVVEPTTARGTAVSYRGHVERYVIPALGHLPLVDLTGQDIQGMIAALVASRYAPSTIRVTRNVLAAALTVAVEDWRLIPFNPTPRRGLPRVRRTEPPEWTPERAHAILVAVQGSDAWGATALALLYGLRISEALGVRRTDIGEGTVRIAGQLDRFQPAHAAPKTTWSERELPLVPLAVEVIATQPVRGPWLFSRPDGRPTGHRDLTRTYEAALRDAGVAGEGPLRPQHLHYHALRHGCVSLLRGLGVEERTRQAIVGHAPEGTHGRYGGTTARAVQDALERLSALLTADTVQ